MTAARRVPSGQGEPLAGCVARLARAPGVSAWTVSRARTTEEQRYLLGGGPAAERSLESTTTTVSVFHAADGHLGSSAFTLSGDEPLTPSRIEEGVYRARLLANPVYPLPPPGPRSEVQIVDGELAGDLRRPLRDVRDRVSAALSRAKGVRLANLELFVSRVETEIRTSAGVAASKRETGVLLQLTLLAREGAEESESGGDHVARRLRDLDIERIVAHHVSRARDRLRAALPATRRGPVVLSDGCFRPLFEVFRTATSGEALYRKISPLLRGGQLLGERTRTGDALTLAHDPTLAWATASTPFDEEGLALRRVVAVENGVFRNAIAGSQYAHYLGIPPTGEWRNLAVAPGRTPLPALLAAGDGPLLHIVEFSWLNPDAVSGAFSVEVRLGYELGGGGRRPVTGGSLSGNVYDAFASAHLSRESELRDDYAGPLAIRFDELQVTGG